jgi:hypothetical protein
MRLVVQQDRELLGGGRRCERCRRGVDDGDHVGVGSQERHIGSFARRLL